MGEPLPASAGQDAGADAVSRRILVFGWGAAAAEVLRELSVYSGISIRCISHESQDASCDLRDVCDKFGFECVITDDADELYSDARDYAPDLIVSASYRKRLPRRVLDLATDCINFHPSLLPKHRGCWSGFWAIFEGDAETGVTCHRMVQEFDAGLLLHQERQGIAPDDTSYSIYKKLLPVTARCARKVFEYYMSADGLPPGEEQQGEGSYHFRQLPFQGVIQPEWSDAQVERFIRAMYFPPFDGAAVLTATGRRLLVDNFDDFVVKRQRVDDDAEGEGTPGSALVSESPAASNS